MDIIDLMNILKLSTGEKKSDPGKIYRISLYSRGEIHANIVRYTNESLEMWIDSEYIGWIPVQQIKTLTILLRGK